MENEIQKNRGGMLSIIIPSFNQGNYIKETIDSCLSQLYRPIEILVMDGASTDNTLEVLKEYHNIQEVKLLSEPDEGVVDAVNKGFQKAVGEIFAVQSSDDTYLPGTFDKVMQIFKDSPSYGLIYGDTIKTDECGNEVFKEHTKQFSIEKFLSKQTWIPQPSAFFRQKLVVELNGWDKTYFNADTEFWLRMIFKTSVLKIDYYMSLRRMHPNQRDNRASEIVDSYWRMIDESDELKKAGYTLRRAAQCGKYLHAIRYKKSDSYLLNYYYYWMAVIYYPEITKHVNVFLALLPGYDKMYKVSSKLGKLRL